MQKSEISDDGLRWSVLQSRTSPAGVSVGRRRLSVAVRLNIEADWQLASKKGHDWLLGSSPITPQSSLVQCGLALLAGHEASVIRPSTSALPPLHHH